MRILWLTFLMWSVPLFLPVDGTSFFSWHSQICFQDCLDGRLSVLIRCPSSEAIPDLTTDKITNDLYVTLHERSSNEHIKGDTAILIQAFCKKIALPYLHHFHDRCVIENINPPKHQCKFLSWTLSDSDIYCWSACCGNQPHWPGLHSRVLECMHSMQHTWIHEKKCGQF